MKSYCVKQKKQTECVPGSEKIVTTKNGRKMMKCKCAECGITKAKFVKTTGGATGMDAVRGIQKVTRKGLEKIPVVGSIIDPIMDMFKRSDEEKFKEWTYMDQFAKQRLTPTQYKKYKAGDKRDWASLKKSGN